jgi:hypothetical protein
MIQMIIGMGWTGGRWIVKTIAVIVGVSVGLSIVVDILRLGILCIILLP